MKRPNHKVALLNALERAPLTTREAAAVIGRKNAAMAIMYLKSLGARRVTIARSNPHGGPRTTSSWSLGA